MDPPTALAEQVARGRGGGGGEPSLSQDVAAVRTSQQQLAPTKGQRLLRDEIQKLILHLGWDTADYLSEATETLPGKSPEVMRPLNGS